MSATRRLVGVILSSILLSGCATTAPYTAPMVELPPTYRNKLRLDAPDAKPAAEQWWQEFDDPVLDKLIETALADNLQVEAAAARLSAAQASLRGARAARLPSADASASANTLYQSLDRPEARIGSQFPGFERTAEQFGLQAGLSWELDLFGRLSSAARASAAEAEAALAGVADAQLTIAAELARSYIDARALAARLRIAHARIDTLATLHRLVGRRVESGASAPGDFDQIEAELESARSAIPILETALEQTHNRIDLLLGRAPGFASAEIGSGKIPAIGALTVDATPAILLRRRPDVFAAERRVAAADARIGQALAAYYPRFNLGSFIGFLSSGLSGLFSSNALEAGANGNAGIRLFDFGSAKAGVDGVRAQTREAIATYRETALRAAGEAENAFAAYRNSQHRIGMLASATQALERAQRASRAAHAAGASSLIDVLSIDRRLQTTQDELVLAEAEFGQAAIQVHRALGGGWNGNPAP